LRIISIQSRRKWALLAFTTLGLYNAVRFPLSMLPLSIKGLAETIVAFKRLKMYLNQPELVDKRKVNLTPKRISLKVDASFTWPARVEGTNFIPITKKEKKEPKKINPTIENGKSEQGPITEVGCHNFALILLNMPIPRNRL
jgi:hypothetical protein